MCSEQKPQKVIYNADRQAAPDRQDESVVPRQKIKETVNVRLPLLEKVFCYLWGVAKTI